MIIGRLRSALFYVLLALCLGLLAGVASRLPWQADWTDTARNLADPATAALLRVLEGPVRITAFAPEHPVMRANIEALIARLQRSGGRIELVFVDPIRAPDLAREAGVRRAGELLLEYRGQRERVASASERAIAETLARLARRGSPWIVAVSGHGERELLSEAPADLGRFAALLEGRGYRVLRLSLSDATAIPDNTALVILAAPQRELDEAAAQSLSQWIAEGGALLWLAEPPLSAALARRLGVSMLPGRVVDAAAADVGLDDPTVVVAAQHPDHPALTGIDAPLLLPGAAAFEVHPPPDWSLAVIATSSSRSWNETGPVKGEVRRDGVRGEHPGPLPVALALTRRTDRGGEQRIAVIGDADWASNAGLGLGANRRFGLGLVHWLTAEQGLLQVPPRQPPDQRIAWSPRTGAVMGIGWLVVAPLALALVGVAVRVRRGRR